jgi:hypothetical protein
VAGRVRRWRTAAGGGAQAAREGDWAHQWSMCSGGWVGEAAGERRRQAHGGASALARIPVSGGEVRANKRPWELPCVLGVMPSC